MTLQSSETNGGYVCGTCGDWVPYGQEHQCHVTVTPTYTYPCCACFNQLQQLIDKIDKLINLLQKNAEKEGK